MNDDSVKHLKINNPNKNKDGETQTIFVDIDLSKFEGSNSVLNKKEQEPKYNLKIKKRDLVLIDELANFEGISRAEFVNKLIYNFLFKQLMNIKDGDNELANNELRMLIASRADAISKKYNNPDFNKKFVLDSKGWTGDVVHNEVYESMKNTFMYGQFQTEIQPNDLGISEQEFVEEMRSDTYKKIREKLLEK